MFDEEYREQLTISLNSNKGSFEKGSIQIINDAVKNTQLEVLINELYFDDSNRLDLGLLMKNIKESIDKSSYKIHLKTGNGSNFKDNELKTNIIKPEYPMWGSPKQIALRRYREYVEYKSEGIFWDDTDVRKWFSSLNNFDCFENTIIEIDDVARIKHQNLKYEYNKIGWLNYIDNLIRVFFPEYNRYTNKSGAKVRFLRQITENLYFGFEYDTKEIKEYIKKGSIGLPDYFNLVLVHKESIDHYNSDYFYSFNPNILSLGILGNPVFYKPCYSLISFATIELYHRDDIPDNFEPQYNVEFVSLDNTKVLIQFPKDYGERLKMHAFYYMYLLTYSSKPYIEFLIRSLE